MIPDSNAHVLLVGVEARFQTTVASQDVVLLEHVDDNIAGLVGGQHLAEEVVGLRRHDAQEWDGAELLLKIGTLVDRIIIPRTG